MAAKAFIQQVSKIVPIFIEQRQILANPGHFSPKNFLDALITQTLN